VPTDLAGFAFVTRGKDVRPARPSARSGASALAPRSASTASRKPDGAQPLRLPGDPGGTRGCVLPCGRGHASWPRKKKSPIGVTRAGIVYELFFTNLPQPAFTACDVVELYLHRGAFEPLLSDEDSEQEPDRWCSHSARGQETWGIVSQWVWSLRLELGHQLHPDPVRTTEAGSCHPISPTHSTCSPAHGSCFGLYVSSGGPALESGPFLWSGFCSPARWNAAVPSRTAQRAIRLEGKIGSGEATSFPGSGRSRWTIPRGWDR
jgi:hypothetical protein